MKLKSLEDILDQTLSQEQRLTLLARLLAGAEEIVYSRSCRPGWTMTWGKRGERPSMRGGRTGRARLRETVAWKSGTPCWARSATSWLPRVKRMGAT
ncbi:MAG TPA: hypothetical protein VGO93_04045 [Candidatus Xenobia bacterium]|jgi:hypothetical protein